MKRQRDRTRRLQVYTSTQLQRLKWKITNQTADWTQTFHNLEETVQCINQNFDIENQCQYTHDETIGSLKQNSVKHSRKPVRVVKVKKRKPTPIQVTIDPFAISSADPTARRPSGTSLAFHRQGNALKVIPLVEKRILENNAKKGILNSENTDEIQLKDSSSNRQPRNVPIYRNLGKVTFQEDGSINIRLVDPESEPSSKNHVMNKDSSVNAEIKDTKKESPDRLSNLYDTAGNSDADATPVKNKVTDLKAWTYDDLMELGHKLSGWMKDQISNTKVKGKICTHTNTNTHTHTHTHTAYNTSQYISECCDIDRWTQRLRPVQLIYPTNNDVPLSVFCHEDWILIQRNEVGITSHLYIVHNYF